MKITDEQRQKKESVELAWCYDKCARVLWARMMEQEAEWFDLMKAADAPGDLFSVLEANLQVRVAGEAIFLLGANGGIAACFYGYILSCVELEATFAFEPKLFGEAPAKEK